MKELSITSQQKINGGGAIVYVISLVAVAAGYSVAKLLRKRFWEARGRWGFRREVRSLIW